MACRGSSGMWASAIDAQHGDTNYPQLVASKSSLQIKCVVSELTFPKLDWRGCPEQEDGIESGSRLALGKRLHRLF